MSLQQQQSKAHWSQNRSSRRESKKSTPKRSAQPLKERKLRSGTENVSIDDDKSSLIIGVLGGEEAESEDEAQQYLQRP